MLLFRQGVSVFPVMPCSRYKHLSWHMGSNNYIVQCHRTSEHICKAFDTEAAGVAYLIKKIRRSQARLLRSSRRVMMKLYPLHVRIIA